MLTLSRYTDWQVCLLIRKALQKKKWVQGGVNMIYFQSAAILALQIWEKILQNLKRFSTGEHKATVRHNTFLQRLHHTHSTCRTVKKNPINPHVLQIFCSSRKSGYQHSLQKRCKGGMMREFPCSQQVQLPVRSRM